MAEFILGVPVLCWKNYTGIRGYQTAKQSNSRQSCVGKKKKFKNNRVKRTYQRWNRCEH